VDRAASPEPPGLAFQSRTAAAGENRSDPGAGGLPEVSVLLNEAQALFERGERDAASDTLVRAAQAYDRLGRFDSAAAIYRSLSRARSASLQVMMLWLKNCQRRNDLREAASVACELGDRAISEDDPGGAREWFERAHAYDGENPTATRRLERLNARPSEDANGAGSPPAVPVSSTSVADEKARSETIRAESGAVVAERPTVVEVTLGNGEPIGMDLGVLIAEFQRGLDEQLDCDPQGHYDLAMSYREMSLHDQAIQSFRVAARDSHFRMRCTEMIGRCLLERGDFEEAVQEFRAALALPELPMGSSLDMRFHLGLALEAAGRPRESLDEFERIYTADPSFPDAASKIRALRKSLEQP
jgi:tetratricopeptide (TPR) repeat protein